MNGTSRDWDWRPWDRPGLSDYSETDSSGTLQTFDARAGFRFPVGRRVDLQFSVGYDQSMIDLDDQNLTGSYDYGQTPVSYQGPVDTYSADFSGFCFGGALAARVADRLTLLAGAEAIVNLSVSADAEWLRSGDSFAQSANGTGLTVSGKAKYAIRKNLALTAQAAWVSQTARDGHQSGTQDGIPYDSGILRNIEMEYVTAGIGVAVRF